MEFYDDTHNTSFSTSMSNGFNVGIHSDFERELAHSSSYFGKPFPHQISLSDSELCDIMLWKALHDEERDYGMSIVVAAATSDSIILMGDTRTIYNGALRNNQGPKTDRKRKIFCLDNNLFMAVTGNDIFEGNYLPNYIIVEKPKDIDSAIFAIKNIIVMKHRGVEDLNVRFSFIQYNAAGEYLDFASCAASNSSINIWPFRLPVQELQAHSGSVVISSGVTWVSNLIADTVFPNDTEKTVDMLDRLISTAMCMEQNTKMKAIGGGIDKIIFNYKTGRMKTDFFSEPLPEHV